MIAKHSFVSLILCTCIALLLIITPGSALAQSKEYGPFFELEAGQSATVRQNSSTGATTNSAPNAQAAQCLNTPETITVPATSPEAPTSKTVLKADQSYLLVMSGVFSYWDASGQTAGADSLYEYRNEAQPNLWSPLWLNNKEIRTLYPNEASIPKYSGDHVYRAVITGEGSPVTFKINESGGYADNSGALTVALCETSTVAPSGQLAIRTSKDVYGASDVITAEYSGLASTKGNWMTVVDAAAKPDSYGEWHWLEEKSVGTLDFGPHPAGTYEVRLYMDWPAGGYTIAARYPFRVEGAGTGAMTLEAPRVVALPNSERLIEIKLSHAANIANMNFDLQYDPAVIALNGDPLKGNLLDNALFTPNASQAGTIRSAFARTSGISSDQPGTVLSVPIRVVGKPGDKSPLDLTVTTINDPNGGALNIQQLNGEVLVANPDGTVPGSGDGSTGSGSTGSSGGGAIPPGDCNGDLRVTELDALCALEMSVDLRDDQVIMDVDNSGLPITSRDAVVILQRAVGQ